MEAERFENSEKTPLVRPLWQPPALPHLPMLAAAAVAAVAAGRENLTSTCSTALLSTNHSFLASDGATIGYRLLRSQAAPLGTAMVMPVMRDGLAAAAVAAAAASPDQPQASPESAEQPALQ